MTKARHNISVDQDVWEGAGKVLIESSLTRSSFIEMVLRAVWMSNNASYRHVTDELFGGLVKAAQMNQRQKKIKKKK